MARPKSPVPLRETKVRLFEGDLERLQELFPGTGGAGAIRILVRAFLTKVEKAKGAISIDLDLDTESLMEELNG